MLSLIESDNGRVVEIQLGESVCVTLQEHATTGYRWAIDHYDKECIEAVSTEPRYALNVIGAVGEVAFTFRGKTLGIGEIALKYWRHWEGDKSVIARFRVQLHVGRNIRHPMGSAGG